MLKGAINSMYGRPIWLLFVGFFFIGGFIGYMLHQATAGWVLGIGMGFVAIAIARMFKS